MNQSEEDFPCSFHPMVADILFLISRLLSPHLLNILISICGYNSINTNIPDIIYKVTIWRYRIWNYQTCFIQWFNINRIFY